MKFDKGLQAFLDEAIAEKEICSVEGSFRRPLTNEEEHYINEQLKPHGHAVNCFKCDVCSEHSGGKYQYHLERISLEERRFLDGKND